MQYKQPRSIQVVVFSEGTTGRSYLLLKRVAEYGGFWQSVTGSLEDGESHRVAAVREVEEETGYSIKAEELIDLGLTNTFKIADRWLHKYEPGVVYNEEVCFGARVDKAEVTIDPLEHEAFVWADYAVALDLVHWETNKRSVAAVERLRSNPAS